MNKDRRNRIKQVIAQLETCTSNLETVRDEEEEAHNNTPENLQGGEVYCESEESSGKIEDALSDIQSAVSTLEEI